MYAATKGKYTLLVLEDSDPMNPREDYEPFGRMVCWHSRYQLGDVHEYADPTVFLQDMVMTLFKDNPTFVFEYVKRGQSKEVRLEYDRRLRKWHLKEPCSFGSEIRWYNTCSYNRLMQNRRISDDALYDVVHALGITDLKVLLSHVKGFILIPLYLYDHSGITMSTSPFSCPWDSGQVGWIYCTPEMLRMEFGSTAKASVANARDMMEAEVRTYDCYLRGECYGYQLYLSGEEVDSCWGFLGEIKDLKDDLRGNLPLEAASLVDMLEYTYESEASYLLNHTVA